MRQARQFGGQGRGRPEVVADAAISVIAEGGMRALTHRAVDTRADLPAGSTSNVYRTRRALIAGVVERVAALDIADLEQMEPDPRSAVELLDSWTHQEPERLLARLELTVEAQRDPDVSRVLSLARSHVVSWIDAARSSDPEANHLPDFSAAQIVALLGGLQWAEVTTGERLTEIVLARLLDLH